jgi:NADH-quinone oxidoreductase subunit H
MSLDELLLILLQCLWALVMFSAVSALAGLMTWGERKQASLIQDRVGPNRANINLSFIGLGNWKLLGIFHIIADAVKSLTKEDFVPEGAYKILHMLGPLLSLGLAFVMFAVVPFAGPLTIHWKDIPAGDIPLIGGFFSGDALHLSNFTVTFQAADLNVGIIFVLALGALLTYGVIMAGFASNNKFSFLGAMRAASQMFSYEIALGLSVIGVIMMYGSANLGTIVERQGDLWFGLVPKWGILTQPLAFILFFTCGLMEIKRIPFDVPEGESEIVAGYFLEYSGAKFMMFLFSEYVELIMLAAMTAMLFFGGWQIPFVNAAGVRIPLLHINFAWESLAFVKQHGFGLLLVQVILLAAQAGFFAAKIVVFCWVLVTVRWTWPRFRYDQIMRLGWRRILPLAMLNIVITMVMVLAELKYKDIGHTVLRY